jgi:hypothetical protein
VDHEDDDRAAALIAWLEGQGYVRTAEVAAALAGGNRTTRLTHGPCDVTVSRDRGQWFVEAGPRDGDGFDMNLWEAHLRDLPPPIDPAPFEDEVRLLRNMLHEIERALVLDDEALPRLETLQAWRNDVRWSSSASPVY